MKVNVNQFYIFVILFLLGLTFGVIHSILTTPFEVKKSILIKNLLNFLVFLILTLTFIIVYDKFKMPNFRVYMYFSVLLGFFISYKTFRIWLAKILKKVYNKIVKFRRRK